MGNKEDKSINLRMVSGELRTKLKVRAAAEDVTLQSLCVRFLWQGLDEREVVNGREAEASNTPAGGRGSQGEQDGGGNGAGVSVLPKAKVAAKRLRTVHAVRSELDGRGGSDARSSDESHEGHRVLPNGDKRWCSDCKVNF